MSIKIQTCLLAILILIIDQVSKVWVKTHMQLFESIDVIGDWFQILFTENPGMAFGWAFGGDTGKLILTVFRIIIVACGLFYFPRLFKLDCSKAFILAVTAIFAGAIGNIIDSIFYGIIFDHSQGQVATLFASQTYAPLFYGHVVDMLYFPLVETTLPDFLPIIGGDSFVFFRFIFNVADSAVCVGVFYILIFERKSLRLVLNQQPEGLIT